MQRHAPPPSLFSHSFWGLPARPLGPLLPCSAYAVWLLRMVTSCEIKRRADFFAPFIMVGGSERVCPAVQLRIGGRAALSAVVPIRAQRRTAALLAECGLSTLLSACLTITVLLAAGPERPSCGHLLLEVCGSHGGGERPCAAGGPHRRSAGKQSAVADAAVGAPSGCGAGHSSTPASLHAGVACLRACAYILPDPRSCPAPALLPRRCPSALCISTAAWPRGAAAGRAARAMAVGRCRLTCTTLSLRAAQPPRSPACTCCTAQGTTT